MLRLFVQVVERDGSLSPAQMRFISSADQQGDAMICDVIKQMSVQVEKEATFDGFATCYLLEEQSLCEVNDIKQLQDNGHYILCPSNPLYEAFMLKRRLKLAGLESVIEEEEDEAVDNNKDMLPQEDNKSPEKGKPKKRNFDNNSASNEEMIPHVENRKKMSSATPYYIDENGALRDHQTDVLVSEIMNDPSRSHEIYDIVKSAIFYIQMDMVSEMQFARVMVPMEAKPYENMHKAQCSIFVTENWRKSTEMLLVINGGRGVAPGIWSRDLLIQDGLSVGSMLPALRKGKQRGFSVVVLNPFTNSITLSNGNTISIQGSSTPSEHTEYVWNTIVKKSAAKQVIILGFKHGSTLAKGLLAAHDKEAMSLIKGIAVVEGEPSRSEESRMVRKFWQQRALSFLGHHQVPPGERIRQMESQMGCVCISAGNPERFKVSCSRYSSNKGRAMSIVLDCVFDFFDSVIGRGSTAKGFSKLHASIMASSIRKNYNLFYQHDALVSTQADSLAKRKSSVSYDDDINKSTQQPIRSTSSTCVHDFAILKMIGSGSIGKVFAVRKQSDDKIYAMKVLEKNQVITEDLVNNILNERHILKTIHHPFIACLRFSFQTKSKLYLVTEYCPGGELFQHMTDSKAFSVELCRFYVGEMILGIEHLHESNIIYRDLKPENVLIDSEGHIRLTDFGLSKSNVQSELGTTSVVGSAEYLAPEIYLNKTYSMSIDWWSLGVLLFEMMAGRHPFYDRNQNVMVQRILSENYIDKVFPKSMPEDARDLVKQLLQHNATKRLGFKGAQEIKEHRFFNSINWSQLAKKEVLPPWKPKVSEENALDFRNFDAVFTTQAIEDIADSDIHLDSIEERFDEFSFGGEFGPATRRNTSASSIPTSIRSLEYFFDSFKKIRTTK